MRQSACAPPEIDGRRGTGRPDTDDFIARIYRVLGDALDRDPGEEPIPVRDAIEPEALVAAFNDDTGETYVSFPIEDRRVTVHSDGEVLVHPE